MATLHVSLEVKKVFYQIWLITEKAIPIIHFRLCIIVTWMMIELLLHVIELQQFLDESVPRCRSLGRSSGCRVGHVSHCYKKYLKIIR